MIYLRAKKLNGEVLVNSFPESFFAPKIDDEKIEKQRYFRKDTNFGNLEVLMIEESRITNSNKVFKAFVISLEITLEKIIENTRHKAREMTDDYLHNIIKIHGNQKSIVERCVEGAEGQDSYDNFVGAVKDKIQKNPDDFADDICALSKEIRLIDYHIGGYNLLRAPDSMISITNNHNLKKFLLGLSHLFFESLKKNDVVLSLHNVDQNFKCSFEYETFNIAMHSFLENIIKYAKPYTTVAVYTKNQSGELIFEMESVRIDKNEIDKIFERGVYGKNVPDYLHGKGIGMYQLKTALDRSSISIAVVPDLSKNSKYDDVNYTKNTFIFRFPNYSI